MHAYFCGWEEFARTQFCDDSSWYFIRYHGWFQEPCGRHETIPKWDHRRCFRCYLNGSHDEPDDDERPAYHAYPDAYHPRPGFDPDIDMASEHGALSVRSEDEDPAPAGYYVLPEERADLAAEDDANANAEADDSDSLYDSDAENDASAAPGYDPSLPDTESDYDAAAAPTYEQGYLPAPHLLANIQARLEARRAEELTDEEYREQEELADEEYDSEQYP